MSHQGIPPGGFYRGGYIIQPLYSPHQLQAGMAPRAGFPIAQHAQLPGGSFYIYPTNGSYGAVPLAPGQYPPAMVPGHAAHHGVPGHPNPHAAFNAAHAAQAKNLVHEIAIPVLVRNR